MNNESEGGWRCWPGTEITLELVIQHQTMNFDEALAVYAHRERKSIELHLRGQPYQLADQRGYPDLKAMRSEALMRLIVPGGAAPGFYDFARLLLISAGAQTFRYSADELGDAAPLSFEVVEEPAERPQIETMRYTPQ